MDKKDLLSSPSLTSIERDQQKDKIEKSSQERLKNHPRKVISGSPLSSSFDHFMSERDSLLSTRDSIKESFSDDDIDLIMSDSKTDMDDMLAIKEKLRKEKEKVRKQEELLRKFDKMIQQKKEDDKVPKDLLKKEKERHRKEQEELRKKSKLELKKEFQRLHRLTYDFKNKEVEDMMTGWVKMRGPLKNWHLRYFVLRPGKLIYYKDELTTDCQGIILLRGCKVVDRPSKKTGFCFKIFHPLEMNIYSIKGLSGEPLPSGLVPLSADRAILRVNTEVERANWIAALTLSIESCSPRQIELSEIRRESKESDLDEDDTSFSECDQQLTEENDKQGEKGPTTPRKYIKEQEEETVSEASNKQLDNNNVMEGMRNSTEVSNKKTKKKRGIKYTKYVPQAQIDMDVTDEGTQEETLGNDSKALILMLLKQVRPGMDLSRVVLPTFILEPRSMLEKLSDFLAHCELLAIVPTIQDPKQRIISLTKWYLSGFYIKPKGVKKPYNPVLGELFRCQWNHPSDSSRTIFVSEQVSHHPPISAFYASNRKAGFIANGSMIFRSKFTGTSAGSVLDGFATVYILPFNEEYEITFPSVWAKGFLFGTLLMELGGSCTIMCAKTGYCAEIEFKQKPLIGGEYNVVTAKIKKDKTTLYTITGKWDSKIEIKDEETKESSILWYPSPEIRKSKIPKCKPPFGEMEKFESDKLWSKVTVAIEKGDQNAATEQKAIIEQAQREAAKSRTERGVEWKPRLFMKNNLGIWTYKYMNKTLWDPTKDIEEVEANGIIKTLTLVDDSGSSASEDDDTEILEGDQPMVPTAEVKDITKQMSKSELRKRKGKKQSTNYNVRKNSKQIEPLDVWKNEVDDRLMKMEKDILVLRQKLEQKVASPSKLGMNKWYFLAFFLAFIFYFWR